VYTTENTALPSRWVDHIMLDDAGNGWFSTSGGGIGMYDGKRWTDYNPDNWGTAPWPFATDSATSSVEADDGTIWVAPTHHGVGEWDGERWIQHLPTWAIESLTIDPNGDVWAMPDRGQVQRWDGTRWIGMGNPSGNADLNEIAADSSGNIWLATIIGLMRYDGTTWRNYTPGGSGIPAQYVVSVAPEPTGGAVWVGTSDGVARFDGGTGWEVYTEADGLPADVIQSIAIAPNGDIWLGAFDGGTWPYHGGVGHFDGETWTSYTAENSPLQHEQVEAITVGADGRVWLGSTSEGTAIVTP
jgi:ligand-binding sensor domain-containing protein